MLAANFQGGIWVISADGGGMARVTWTGRDPDWSPDGSRIVFELNSDIWVMDADGANQTRLTRFPWFTAGNPRPVWSPDGTEIAFAYNDNTQNPRLDVMKSDGTGQRTLATAVSRYDQVAWSPDGSRIAYAAKATGSTFNSTELWTVRRDGTDAHRVLTASDVPGDFTYVSSPTWRPALTPAQPYRVAGVDRMDTAVKVSQESFDDRGASAVVLARQDIFADAVAGGPLAAAKDAPLLLTPTASLDRRVADEMRRVLPSGGTVYLLGAQASLSTGVETAVRALGFKVVRIAGVDRFDTSVRIAREIGSSDLLMLATGLNFPDALTAGSAAGAYGGAVLLTNGKALPKVVGNYLGDQAESIIYTVGGDATAAFPDADAHLAGRDRYETAVMVASEFFAPSSVAGLANGQNFPDALAAGPFLSGIGAPLLLTQPDALPKSTADYLFLVGSAVDDLVVFGSTPSVADNTVKAALAALN